MKLNDRQISKEGTNETVPMPVLFIGHGSPMNALEDNEFSRGWQAVAKTIPVPRAVLCISAHWETCGTFVTAMEKPRTIHDFHGFPEALFEVLYPAPGSPDFAKETIEATGDKTISPDLSWGIDHGCWSVMKHFYPLADVPVLQLSLNYLLDAAGHYNLAKQLASLRRKGVLIIGSGNVVHNLRLLNWKNPDEPCAWAEEANSMIKNLIMNRNHRELMNYTNHGKEMQLAIPTPEHFLPLLYALALQEKEERITFFNDKPVMGSISMTSLIIN